MYLLDHLLGNSLQVTDTVCRGFKFAELEMSAYITCIRSTLRMTNVGIRCLAEIVLAELISTFALEKTDAPVIWNLGEVIHPTLSPESSRPEYPMKVALAH